MDERPTESSPTTPPPGLRVPFDAVLAEIVKRVRSPIILGAIAFVILLLGGLFLVPDVLDKAPALPWGVLGFGLLVLLLVVVPEAYFRARKLALQEWREREGARRTEPERRQSERPVLPTAVPPLPSVSPAPPPDPDVLRERYLDTLITECCRARLVGLDPQAADPARGGLSLERLYISLDTLTRVEEEEPGKRRRKGRETFDASRETPPLSALEALAHAPEGHMVLVGLPGAGKSTFVRYLALRMAQALRNPALNLANLLPGWTHRPLLPLIVPLGRLAESVPIAAQHGDADATLKDYGKTLLAALRREGGLVLFDGLDEVADLTLRPVVRQAIEDFANRYGSNGVVHFLVTCRTYSYTDARWQLTGWPTHALAPLDEEKIRQFVEAWHAELSRVDPARADDYTRKCQKMLQALAPSDRRRLAEIAPNPLILTVMAVVHTHKGELPDARALVYEECMDLLLVRWEMERTVLGQQSQKRSLLDALGVPRIALENALQEIAYRAHEGGSRPGVSEGQAALVTEGLITDVLQAAFNDLDKVRTFLQYSESANGLLMLQGVAPLPDAPPDAPARRVYAFPHMTFEEYLAGRYLGRMSNRAAKVREHVDRGDRWREPVMLLGEHICFRTGDFEPMDAILDKLVPDPPPRQPTVEDWRATWLAGDLLMLYRRAAVQSRSAFDERVVERLAALVQAGTLTPMERAAAGNTLAVLGDPRPGVRAYSDASLPDISWCYVPPGPFLMGSTSEDVAWLKRETGASWDEEAPQHERDIPYDYWISRYPITNAQFALFVQDQGYVAGDWWPRAGLKWRADRRGPETYGNPFDLPNHPVVGVTWYEAVAYCNWLTERLRMTNDEWRMANGEWRIRLPTEAEWEKAARGGLTIPAQPLICNSLQLPTSNLQPPTPNPRPARIYPWGSTLELDVPDPDRANYDDSGIRATSAVGLFPGGASPYGCLDLSGNVWEWCLTKWVDNYKNYDKIEGREDSEGDDPRVLRGGSWANYWYWARCAWRYWNVPLNRDVNRGFRVCVSTFSPFC